MGSYPKTVLSLYLMLNGASPDFTPVMHVEGGGVGRALANGRCF